MPSRNARLAVIVAAAVAFVAAAGWFMTNGRGNSGEPKKIGIVQLTSAIDAFPNGMKDGMKEFGYEEGKDVVYDYVTVEQDINKAEIEVQRMVNEGVDVIYAITNPVLASALKITQETGNPVPIVFVGVDKPVESGLIAGFSSSGNNSTGIMGSVSENVPTQLRLLRELMPDAKRIGIFSGSFIVPHSLGELSRIELLKAAPEYGFEIVEYETDVVPEPGLLEKEFERLADRIRPGDIDAVFHLAAHWIPDQQFMEIALSKRLGKVVNVMPTIEEVVDGGTYGYAPDLYAVGKDTAVIIDKILRGERPENIPVETPRHNVLWVNPQAAQERGIVIPDSLLTKADHRVGE